MSGSPLVREFLERRDSILAFIGALTRNLEVAEEIFQEVGLSVVEHARRDDAVRSFDAWIREIVRRRVADYYREKTKTTRRLRALPESLADVVCQAFDEATPDTDELRVRQRLLGECLDGIAGRTREAIVRRYRDGLDLAAVAEALQWQVASVKVALSRGRRALLDCVQSKLRGGEAAQHG